MKNVRAVICDVYRTILDVLPPPSDAGARWEELCRKSFGEIRLTLGEVSERCRAIVTEDHASAKALGVLFPEVVWPNVMARALSPLGALDAAARESFLFAHMQLLRGLRLMPGAANVLRRCAEAGLLLGIASNAQQYTLRELSEALAAEGLSVDIFDPGLCVWSWRMGFSKPNPHVFRILAARFAPRGIAPGEILMIGDRLDNDVAPAAAFGWQTFHIVDGEASWRELAARFGR